MEAISLRLLQTSGSFIKRDRLPELWASEIFNSQFSPSLFISGRSKTMLAKTEAKISS